MSGNLSEHHPLIAGGTVEVTGTLEVDTDLRDLHTVVVSLVSTPSADAAFVKWSYRIDGGRALVTLSVYKDDYSASIVAANVSWLAIEK